MIREEVEKLRGFTFTDEEKRDVILPALMAKHNKEITITIAYAVRGLNYDFGGVTTRKLLGEENIFPTIEEITNEINATYKGYKVEITNVYVDSSTN